MVCDYEFGISHAKLGFHSCTLHLKVSPHEKLDTITFRIVNLCRTLFLRW